MSIKRKSIALIIIENNSKDHVGIGIYFFLLQEPIAPTIWIKLQNNFSIVGQIT